MSFLASKALTLMLYPLSQAIVVMACAMILRVVGWKHCARVLMFLGFAWLYLASTNWLGGKLMRALEAPYPPVAMDTLPRADAIVLLGGGVRARVNDHSLGNLNRWADRILYSAVLYQEGKAPRIVASGGGKENGDTEAGLMRDILAVMGVPADAVVLENKSLTTHDNARYTAPLLRENGWDKVLLVTSAFHMRRAVASFRAEGIDVIAAPTDHQTGPVVPALGDWLPSHTGLNLTTYALHEWLGYHVYAWRGWLRED